MISSDGGDVMRQRTGERKGVAPPPSVDRKTGGERRRKWKNLINEIIPQSTSIRLHSAGALRTKRRAPGQAGGGSVYLVHRKDHRVDESLSLCLSCYYQGQCWAKLLLSFLSLLKLAHGYIKAEDDSVLYSLRDLNPKSDMCSPPHRLSLAAVDYAQPLHLH